MIRFLAIIIASVVMANGGNAYAQCVTPDAKGIVASMKPTEQLRLMLTRTVEGTTTAAAVRTRDGASGERKLAEEIDAAVKRHGAEWEGNLVSSWQMLSADAISQACAAMQNRDFSLFWSLAGRVGSQVQARNEPLLRRAGAEVLKAVW
jgi:hypothetical protein